MGQRLAHFLHVIVSHFVLFNKNHVYRIELNCSRIHTDNDLFLGLEWNRVMYNYYFVAVNQVLSSTK